MAKIKESSEDTIEVLPGDNEQPIAGLPEHLRPMPDMRYVYANNVYFDTSLMDLKMMFGELRRDYKGAFVAQHTSVTMDWTEAKVAAIFLALNVMIHEDTQGAIKLPEGLRPPIVLENEADLSLREIFEAALRRYRDQRKVKATNPQ